MARNTRTKRNRKFPPQYARSLPFEEMPHGGVRGAALEGGQPGLAAWQLPTPRRWGRVVMASGIKWRLCVVAPRFDR